ncbi:unnamed protein product [Mycetohabitans rhizoxinica HKI 454]|uniref:Uncharacterized protein n=1 Tax=Mycetohabitans rhizoxinica (strain DSM 19002 / CIP 109453 / HKI 454) TaxID=882378 RepID=E5AM12_MYCRK|nr:unnamed protein product [Mycetohabitans rhizoxinica HKI 454]
MLCGTPTRHSRVSHRQRVLITNVDYKLHGNLLINCRRLPLLAAICRLIGLIYSRHVLPNVRSFSGECAENWTIFLNQR